MSKGLLEKVAAVASATILAGWLVFWVMQVIGVWKMLAIAYGS